MNPEHFEQFLTSGMPSYASEKQRAAILDRCRDEILTLRDRLRKGANTDSIENMAVVLENIRGQKYVYPKTIARMTDEMLASQGKPPLAVIGKPATKPPTSAELVNRARTTAEKLIAKATGGRPLTRQLERLTGAARTAFFRANKAALQAESKH